MTMKTVYLLATGSMVAAGGLLAPQAGQVPPALKGYCDNLAAAKTFRATVTVQEVPGATEELSAVFARDGKFSLDGPARLVVSDGKTLSVLDKKANSYMQRPVGETVRDDLVGEVGAWGLLPFFEKDLSKLFSSASKKGARKVAGVDCDEVTFTAAQGETGTFYVGKASGLAVGYQLVRSEKTYIVLLKDAKLDGEPVEDSVFAFVAPEGSKMVKAEEAQAGWATVSPIFTRSCMPCHAENRAGGIDLRTYESTVRSGSVVPGDAAASRLVKSLRGTIQPRMPQGRPPLPEPTIRTVETWINAGAKE